MPAGRTKFAQIRCLILAGLVALHAFALRSEQIRPDALTIAGENYKIIYEPGVGNGNHAIVMLDNGKEPMGEGFLLFRDGKTIGSANVNGRHFRFSLTATGANMAEVPRAPKDPDGHPDTLADPNDKPILNAAQLARLTREKIASSNAPQSPTAMAAETNAGTTDAVVSAPPTVTPVTNAGPTIISIMVLYDADAIASLIQYGGETTGAGIQDTIEMSVAEANEAYANCGINVQLNVVYTGALQYTDSGSLTTDLHWLAANTNVTALQAQYGADVVTLMEGANDPQYSGMAFILSGTGTQAFNVVEAIYSVNDYVLAHEVGHNLGCAHDRANAGSPGAFPYSYGYNFGPVSASTGAPAYGTIMCYPGTRAAVFSSPTNFYMGYATGTPSNNNVATIAQRASWVASIFPQPTYTLPLIVNGNGSVLRDGAALDPATNAMEFVVTRGQMLNLTAQGNFICWSGATNTTASNITICPSESTNLVANFVGVASLAPQITTQPQGQSITQGNTLTLVTGAVGVPAPSFQWQFNGTNIATGSTLTISNITSASQGSYICIVSNSAGVADSSVASVVVDQPPVIVQQPVNQLAPPGGTAVFSVFATAFEPSFQWYFNGAPIAAATTRRLSISGITAQDAGSYAVAITSYGFTVESAPAQLLILTPPSILQQPEGTNAVSGETVNLSVNAGGTAPLSYQWECNGTNLDNQTNATLSLTDIQPNQGGVYFVAVSNSLGSVASTNVTLAITRAQSVVQSATSPVAIGIAPAGTGQMNILFSASAGQSCEVQASSDLVQWTTIGTISASAGPNQFTDTGAGQYLTRYYRVKYGQ